MSDPTLLTYAFTTGPDPLVVSSAGSITLVVNNKTGTRVTCQSITVTLPYGTNAADLIASTPVTVVPANGWSVTQDGGLIVLTPPGGSVEVLGQGLSFVFAFTTNNQPGSVTVTIDEAASSPAAPPATRTVSCTTAKFPADFSLSPLTQYPAIADIAHGATAQLSWTVTGEGVTCWLDYQPADSGPEIHAQVPLVPENGVFTTVPLTRANSVTCILTAKYQPAGQDNPLTLQSVLPLTINSMGIMLFAEPPIVGENGLARLRWATVNADHCIDEDNGNAVLPANGHRYVLLTESKTFSISAVGADGQTIPAQATFEFDESIVPTAPGRILIGSPGFSGEPDGHPGLDAEDISAGWIVAPLATSSGGPVIPLTVSGGAGGNARGSGPNATGGNGGSATLNLYFDPRVGPPALYIVTVTSGAGGQGNGGNGSPGSATAMADGQPLTLP